MNKKNTEIALSNPNVSNQINLNLNQSDMIDVVIEHQVEQITKQLEINKRQYDELKTKFQAITDKYAKMIIARSSKGDIGLAQFYKIAKQLKIEVLDNVTLYIDTCKNTTSIGNYQSVSLDRVEQYKDPFGYARRNSDQKFLIFKPLIGVSGSYTAKSERFNLTYSFEEVEATTEEKAGYKKEVMALLKEELELKNKRFALKMSYLEYRYGEKRVKAKIVKASLSKSEEGRGILAMLEGATHVKLLG